MKTCPFCGSSDVYVFQNEHGWSGWVECNDCECNGPLVLPHVKDIDESRRVAIEGWDKRAGVQ